MFKWRRISSVRNRALLLTLLPLLSLMTLFTPLFSQNASAVTADEVLSKARAWSILNAIIDHRGTIDASISNSEIGTCDIFGLSDQNVVRVGAHTTGDNGLDGSFWGDLRNNLGNLGSALDSVGIKGGCDGLLKAIGYTVSGDGLQQPADFGNRLSQRIRDALSPNAFYGANIGDDNPGKAISYAILYYHLTNVCGWQYRNPQIIQGGGTPAEQDRVSQAAINKWGGDTDGVHYYTHTYEVGRASEFVYYKGGGTTGSAYVGSKSGIAVDGNNSATMLCGGNNSNNYTFGARLANDPTFADSYAALLKPGGDSTPGTCLDRYAGQAAELAACDAGFNNKTNPAYCSNNYPNGGATAAQFSACRYGQGTATGGANTTTPPPGGPSDDGQKKETCKIDGIGWILCPVLTFIAEITDGAYTIVASLLEVTPLSVSTDTGLFNAWALMRNFANVSFVIAFLVIIFSQISNVGISNYGIKKMLPKLVVAAILVNVSYWICAIAVDLSNILGGSLKGLLTNMQNSLGLDFAESSAWGSGTGWTGLVGGVLAGTIAAGALFFVTLSILVPMLVTVLATIVTVFLTLVLRQVLIIIMIVISPLAFVAFLLPNTESLFNKWRSIFQILLLIYPIIALVFGGAALASTIIMMSSNEIHIQIAGAAAAVIPLVAAPALIGGVNKVANRFGLPNVGVKLEGMRKSAQGFHEYKRDVARGNRLERGGNVLEGQGGALGGQYSRRRRLAAFIGSAGATRTVNTDKKRGFAKAVADEGAQEYFAKRALNQEGFAEGIAGSAAPGLKASAQSAVDKILRQDIANREILLTADVDFKNDPQKALDEALGKGDRVQASAAINMLMKTGAGGFDKIHNSLNQAEADPSTSPQMMEAMRDHIKDNGAVIKGKDPSLTRWASGNAPTLSYAASDPGTYDAKSDSELAGFSPDAFQEAASRGVIDQARATAIKTNQSLYKDVSKANKAIIESIAAGDPPPTAPTRPNRTRVSP